MADTKSTYRVVHTQVGPFPKGHVVDSEDSLLIGVDIERLKALGAIEEVKDTPSTGPAPEGVENRPAMVKPATRAVTAGEVASAIPPATKHESAKK